MIDDARINALQLANSYSSAKSSIEDPDQVVKRAKTYLKFLTDDPDRLTKTDPAPTTTTTTTSPTP